MGLPAQSLNAQATAISGVSACRTIRAHAHLVTEGMTAGSGYALKAVRAVDYASRMLSVHASTADLASIARRDPAATAAVGVVYASTAPAGVVQDMLARGANGLLARAPPLQALHAQAMAPAMRHYAHAMMAGRAPTAHAQYALADAVRVSAVQMASAPALLALMV